MVLRSFLAWLGILVLAILNGAFRQALLVPRLGDQAGHVLSTVLLSALVVIAAWSLLPWLRPSSRAGAWTIGGLWLGLTVAFEFLAGHYLFRTSWNQLLADYDVTHGRIWVLVPVTTLLAPLVTYLLRRRGPWSAGAGKPSRGHRD